MESRLHQPGEGKVLIDLEISRMSGSHGCRCCCCCKVRDSYYKLFLMQQDLNLQNCSALWFFVLLEQNYIFTFKFHAICSTLEPLPPLTVWCWLLHIFVTLDDETKACKHLQHLVSESLSLLQLPGTDDIIVNVIVSTTG